MFGKQGKSEINWPLLILVVIVVLIAFPAIPEKLSGLFGLAPAPASTTPSSSAPVAGCYIEDTTLTLTADEMYNPATAPGGDHRVWINGDDQGKVVNGGTMTVSPGDTYKVLWGENSTTHYGKVTEGVVPCSGTLKLKESLYQWDVGNTEGNWATITNHDGTLNSLYNQSIGLGQTKNVEVKLEAAYEDAIGNPNVELPNILACSYNKSVLNRINIDEFSSAEVPNLAAAVAGYTWQAWKIPAIDKAELDFKMVLEADETYVIFSSYSNDITCYVYDGDYDIDGNTGEILFGVEDEADNNLGITTGSYNFTVGMTP